MRLLTKFACFALAVVVGSAALAMDQLPRSGRIAIHVENGNWGTAGIQDIERVLASVADALSPHFPQRASNRIVVEYSRTGPRALFEKSADGAYRVLLNVRDRRWDQFAYQFSHELCHIFTNFEHREISRDTASRGHQWFEEAMCEAVSLYSLNRLASSWEHSPPYPGWEHYAPVFREYANRLLSERHRQLQPNESTAQWYRTNRIELVGNPYLREKNERLATRLFSLLEETPGSLEAIGYLNLEGPPAAKSLQAYLESWYDCCPEKYRDFISRIIELFGGRDVGGSTALAVAHSS